MADNVGDNDNENRDPNSPHTTADFSRMFAELGLNDKTAGSTQDYSAVYNDMLADFQNQQNITLTPVCIRYQ
jgi:hypothetical protein